MKAGVEWMHTLNDQVFRGFFTGRYLFDSVTGFLRYASPAASGGFGPYAIGCSNGTYVTFPDVLSQHATNGGPLLLYLQGAGLSGPATDAAGASRITNDELSLFVQDKWQPRANLTVNYGLRWDSQLMPETVDPSTTAFAAFLSDPAFPSDGTIPNQWNMWQPRAGLAWDVKGDGRSVVRASSGIYFARQNMLSQVGTVTTNGLQQQTITLGTFATSFATMPVWPSVVSPTPLPAGQFPAGSGIRVFDKDYVNPRVYSFNAAYEQQLASDVSGYADVTWNEGRHLTRFLNYNRSGPSCCDAGPGTGNTYVYSGAPWGPQLGEVMVTNSRGNSRYRGVTLGVRKRLSHGYQVEANYVLSKDEDDDSNERDPFLDRSFNFFDLRQDWGLADRDIRHKANAFGFFTLPHAVQLERPDAVSRRPADHRFAAHRQWPGSRPQQRAQGQRVLLVRLARGAHLPPRRALRGHPDLRAVQHLQQRQQHQPAEHTGALQFRRVPALGRRRSASGAARGAGGVLRS